MPTPDQLANVPKSVDGDGSSSTQNDDGSTTTSWPDGTTRVDYPDGVATVTYPDGAVLNIEADGTRTLNDQFGTALDPATGQPLEATPDTPTPPPTTVEQLQTILDGGEELKGVLEAKGYVDAFKDALEGEVNPLELLKMWLEMVLQVVKAIETEERGVHMRAWCYGALYGALDMGAPPEPTFSGSLGGPEQDAIDLQAWREGVAAAAEQLADAEHGKALRNRLLLRVAWDGSQPATTITTLWQAACEKSEDTQLARAYPTIGWPQPTGA